MAEYDISNFAIVEQELTKLANAVSVQYRQIKANVADALTLLAANDAVVNSLNSVGDDAIVAKILEVRASTLAAAITTVLNKLNNDQLVTSIIEARTDVAEANSNMSKLIDAARAKLATYDGVLAEMRASADPDAQAISERINKMLSVISAKEATSVLG